MSNGIREDGARPPDHELSGVVDMLRKLDRLVSGRGSGYPLSEAVEGSKDFNPVSLPAKVIEIVSSLFV